MVLRIPDDSREKWHANDKSTNIREIHRERETTLTELVLSLPNCFHFVFDSLRNFPLLIRHFSERLREIVVNEVVVTVFAGFVLPAGVPAVVPIGQRGPDQLPGCSTWSVCP